MLGAERVPDGEFALRRLGGVHTTNSKESNQVMIVKSCGIALQRTEGIDPNHPDIALVMFFAILISLFEPSALLGHPTEGVLGTPCGV